MASDFEYGSACEEWRFLVVSTLFERVGSGTHLLSLEYLGDSLV